MDIYTANTTTIIAVPVAVQNLYVVVVRQVATHRLLA